MKRLLVLVLMGLAGYSPKIKSNYINPQTELTIEDEIALLDIDHELPEDLIKVGELKFQDSGFSTDCSFNSIMNRARQEARKNGANIVKVVDKKAPDIWYLLST
ncbi:hypothetical protein ML462_05885 [Gramella lutea]|uniref:Uncharacterized protein n=1 Tax=Christiangramia lutea TaxID=1607951 RepID=A0A9X2A8M5_9FLAO|nr:hypothetical protein [Christiangramia lutea]MCH4822699.1 hypothetical protein [Christiangramia lutea]